jgi:hypothetical protein
MTKTWQTVKSNGVKLAQVGVWREGKRGAKLRDLLIEHLTLLSGFR